MSCSEFSKRVIAASYLIAYIGTVLWALVASGSASGGMAFVIPVVLGFPWSLLFGLLLLVAPLPKVVVLLLLLVVPPVINVYLMLGTRGFFRLKQDLFKSVAVKDSTTNNEEVP